MGHEQPVQGDGDESAEWPLVTVAIPTYNRLSLLQRALASARAQDYPNLEIVVSDNASTDGTQEFCEELATRDARVRYFRLPTNIGHAGNFRAAFQQVKGPLFTWLADDDWLDESFVSICVEELRTHPDYVLVCGRTIYYAGENPVALNEPEVNLLASSRQKRVLDHYRSVVRNGTMLGVMRRDCIASDPFPAVFGGDWLLVGRLAFAGKVRTLDGVALHRTLGGESGDMVGLATSLGVAPRLARVPNVVICKQAVADIFTSEVYRDATLAARALLALRVVGVFSLRFYLPYFRRLPPELRRQAVRRLRLPHTQ